MTTLAVIFLILSRFGFVKRTVSFMRTLKDLEKMAGL